MPTGIEVGRLGPIDLGRRGDWSESEAPNSRARYVLGEREMVE
jgi:hypothetical protein